jgi:hypothetical protein
VQGTYSVKVCRALAERFREQRLYRPMRVARYDAGDEIVYDMTPVAGGSPEPARVRLVVDRFIGGGFAGQVYRVVVEEVVSGELPGIEVGGTYALKILIPPSRGALFFRNLLYGIGFQGSFQLQTNPTASRAGALWQKLIRRAARFRFGDDRAVNDVHATFVDTDLGSCGELSDWVSGRTWRLEVDDRLDALRRWRSGKPVDRALLGSPEYRAKRTFMKDFVRLLHEMGAAEFARQYEWSTCKSQPNCLKRMETDDDPSRGLTAVDFRAGLALLPFLPMSPGDFKLILQGLGRRSLVQFDRGDLAKLDTFVREHPEAFSDLEGTLQELKSAETTYRRSIPDITHNHFRLLTPSLWATILASAAVGWEIRGLIDKRFTAKLAASRFRAALVYLLGIVPLLGNFVRRLWGHGGWRRHYLSMLSSPSYLARAIRARMAEKVTVWHRAGRVREDAAPRLARSLPRFLINLPLSILPVGFHRLLTDWEYAKERLDYIVRRPVRLYFNASERERWLRQMVEDGRAKQVITDEDAEVILSKIKEPFIQKYLKSLAVHVCTLPVTQVVSVIVAVAYVLAHPEMPTATAWAVGLGIVALFQVVPVSPGSLVRGLYVVWLVIRERNFKDYNIAVFLGFFKYVGYLSFPIQMTYRYPELAGFMAAHWATETVHIVPVFGERGALLERWVFCLFYNWPLTIRRRTRARIERRKSLRPRYWHVPLCAIVAAAILGGADSLFHARTGEWPGLGAIWWLAALVPLSCGAAVTLGAGGASMGRRIVAAVGAGVLTALLYTAITAGLMVNAGDTLTGNLAIAAVWRVFVLGLLTPLGAILSELVIPDPELRGRTALAPTP